MFGPAAAANFRSNLLRSGNLPDSTLRRIDTPTLLLSSAKDRMLPSLAEGEGMGGIGWGVAALKMEWGGKGAGARQRMCFDSRVSTH